MSFTLLCPEVIYSQDYVFSVIRAEKVNLSTGKYECLSVCNIMNGGDTLRNLIIEGDLSILKAMFNEGEDLIAREAHYNNSCKVKFSNREQSSSAKGPIAKTTVERNYHAVACGKTLLLIKRQPMFASEFHKFIRIVMLKLEERMKVFNTHAFQSI